jgi:hypothetical protein
MLNISKFQIHISDGIPSKNQVCEVDSCDYSVLHPLLSPLHCGPVTGHPGPPPHQVQDRPADGAPLLVDDTQQPGRPLGLHLVQQEHTFCETDQQRKYHSIAVITNVRFLTSIYKHHNLE